MRDEFIPLAVKVRSFFTFSVLMQELRDPSFAIAWFHYAQKTATHSGSHRGSLRESRLTEKLSGLRVSCPCQAGPRWPMPAMYHACTGVGRH